jgi:hypothetical protein
MNQKQFLISHKERIIIKKMIMASIKQEKTISQSYNRVIGKVIMNFSLQKQKCLQETIEIEKMKAQYLVIIILIMN